MTNNSTPGEQGLPPTILRPLKFAALGLFTALVLGIVWSTTAPLATSIRVSGTLVSSKPSFEIQHPHNGRIKRVNVRLHDLVQEGQILFELDVSTQRKGLKEITSQIAHIEAENIMIGSVLQIDGQRDFQAQSDVPEIISSHYQELYNQFRQDIASTGQRAKTARNRAQSIQAGIEILHLQKAAMQERSDHLQVLAQKGLVAGAQQEAHSNQLLALNTDINAEYTQLASSNDEATQITLELAKRQTEFRLKLLNKRLTNEARLPELRRASLTVQDEGDQSMIRSPISGSVVSINFDTNHMFIPRGTTLITIAQPLDHPVVDVKIPTQAIDQTSQGMTGVLTISSLPQRNLPKIRVKLLSIAPDAIKDRDGNPVSYLGRASINADDLVRAKKSMHGALKLSADMPVSVVFEGRTITFSEYLVGPFLAIFRGALQD